MGSGEPTSASLSSAAEDLPRAADPDALSEPSPEPVTSRRTALVVWLRTARMRVAPATWRLLGLAVICLIAVPTTLQLLPHSALAALGHIDVLGASAPANVTDRISAHVETVPDGTFNCTADCAALVLESVDVSCARLAITKVGLVGAGGKVVDVANVTSAIKAGAETPCVLRPRRMGHRSVPRRRHLLHARAASQRMTRRPCRPVPPFHNLSFTARARRNIT